MKSAVFNGVKGRRKKILKILNKSFKSSFISIYSSYIVKRTLSTNCVCSSPYKRLCDKIDEYTNILHVVLTKISKLSSACTPPSLSLTFLRQRFRQYFKKKVSSYAKLYRSEKKSSVYRTIKSMFFDISLLRIESN